MHVQCLPSHLLTAAISVESCLHVAISIFCTTQSHQKILYCGLNKHLASVCILPIVSTPVEMNYFYSYIDKGEHSNTAKVFTVVLIIFSFPLNIFSPFKTPGFPHSDAL